MGEIENMPCFTVKKRAFFSFIWVTLIAIKQEIENILYVSQKMQDSPAYSSRFKIK